MVREVARYIVVARDEAPSPPVREAAMRCVLDLMASSAAGIRSVAASATRDAAIDIMGDGQVPIWFSGASGSAAGAAWANSAAAAALDLDDGHRLARGHPGAAVIPTALAECVAAKSTVEDLINAIAIGYEVGVAIGAARTSYGNTGTWSAYAVVATAAVLRRSSATVIEHALAIAGESAPNQLFASAAAQVPPPEGSDVKEGIAWSVMTGIAALTLAERGFTGPRNILDSAANYAFLQPLRLGAAPHILRTYFKLYAACRHVHAPVDAFLGLIRSHSITAPDISEIEVLTYGGALRISNKASPDNLTDIQYSIPYCLGLTMAKGPNSLLPVSEQSLHVHGASEVASKVRLAIDPELDAQFPARTLARVRVKTVDGRVLTSPPTSPMGDADSPLTWSQLEDKFREATRLVASVDQQNRAIAAIGEFRDGDLAALQALLSGLVLSSDLSSARSIR